MGIVPHWLVWLLLAATLGVMLVNTSRWKLLFKKLCSAGLAIHCCGRKKLKIWR
jgi:hypothetical protein